MEKRVSSRHIPSVAGPTTSQNNSNPGNSSNNTPTNLPLSSSTDESPRQQQPIIIDVPHTSSNNNNNNISNNGNNDDGDTITKDLSPEDMMPLTIMNNIRDAKKQRRTNGGSNGGGSNNGSSNGSGNNSDNSALVSLGNNSFGFNFDSEETYGMTNGVGGGGSDPSERDDSDDAVKGDGGKMKGEVRFELPDGTTGTATAMVSSTTTDGDSSRGGDRRRGGERVPNDIITSGGGSSSSSNLMADAAVRGLQMIVNSNAAKWNKAKESKKHNKTQPSSCSTSAASSAPDATKPLSCPSSTTGNNNGPNGNNPPTLSGTKHDREYESDGYDSDNEAPSRQPNDKIIPLPTPSSTPKASSTQQPKNKKGKKMDELKREERNAREKERSFRITRQINDLRDLLSSGGVIVPKGTKSSVLTEAANYIRLLQQHQYRSELERHRLVQQLQIVGSGSMGAPAATAVRHVAAQNGVWSLGNFGGVPPRSAMTFYQQPQQPPAPAPQPQMSMPQAPPGLPGAPPQPQPIPPPVTQDVQQVQKIESHEYRHVFNSCTVAMAIASMGGAFIDCNDLFCKLSQYTKQEVCAMTIFNLTSRIDLQNAFDLISQMISPGNNNNATAENANNANNNETNAAEDDNPPSCLLRGAMKNNRSDLGLSVALIKGDEGVAKCFCVTLVTGVNSSSPYATLRPVPATVESLCLKRREEQQILTPPSTTSDDERNKALSDNMTSAAYTTG